MNIQDLIVLGQQFLHKDQAKLVLGTILNLNPLELNLHLDEKVALTKVNKYQKCLEAIKQGKPIQYALGEVNFYGLNFYVDERVLIPRFETEELVYNTNNYLKKYFSKPKILDLGTGSGCIGLTLKKLNKDYDITMSDIDNQVLEVAYINKNNLKLDVKIINSDLFTNIKEKYDVIISNPPYVAKTDVVSEIVLKNEPHLALYALNDGLEFYEKILANCEKHLKDKYLIAFEIGSSQKERIIELINKNLKNVKIITKTDNSNRDRMIFIFKNIILSE